MVQYRIERAVTGRAGCQQTECKNAGVKIDKEELRLGVWVEIQEHGSWRWNHWGCVTGFKIQNIREYLDPNGTGDYGWDMLDGYDGEDKGSLEGYPDLQEKVRRVITQGFIDPEDFKGDPEMNVLGKKGIRTAASKAQAKAAAAEHEAETEVAGGMKRPKTEDPEDDEIKPPPKKKRASKAKKEEPVSDGEQIEAKPKVKRARKTAVKEEDKQQDDTNDSPVAKSKASSKGRKMAAKKEDSEDAVAVKDEFNEQNGLSDSPKSKPTAKKGRKKSVKKEEPEDVAELPALIKDEVKGEGSTSLSDITPATEEDMAVKGEETDGILVDEEKLIDATSQSKKKKAKKSTAVPKSQSTRASRSRTASKNES